MRYSGRVGWALRREGGQIAAKLLKSVKYPNTYPVLSKDEPENFEL